MNELFALPFGRCLSPSPQPKSLPLEPGALVVWTADREYGLVSAVTPDAVCVFWQESPHCWYPLNSIAATERIALIDRNQEQEDLFA
jgi:hypothetical protein